MKSLLQAAKLINGRIQIKPRSSDYFFWVLTVSSYPQFPTCLRMFSSDRMPATSQQRRANDRYEGNQKIFKRIHVGRRKKGRYNKNHRRTTSQGHSRSFPFQKVHLPSSKHHALMLGILPLEVAVTHLKVSCQKKIKN